MKKVAFIGLGVMGYPMAGHCQTATNQVTVYNRTTAKAERWADEHGGDAAKTPALAALDADFVLICVGNDDDVRSVCYGEDGLLGALKPGALVIDHTTTSAALAQELERAVIGKSAQFIDAPVSGGQAGAENGKLSIMCGGTAAAFSAAEEIFQCYGARWQHLGEAGNGQLCKMVNQVCIAGVVQGLAEGLALAMKSGLDIEKVQKVLAGGSAQSWQVDNRVHTMARGEFDFGFAIDWMIKDLGYCLAEAERKELELCGTAQTQTLFKALQARGFNRSDTSVLLKYFV